MQVALDCARMNSAQADTRIPFAHCDDAQQARSSAAVVPCC